MDEKEPRQESELRDSKVGRVGGLQPLVAVDADTHVGFLNHGDVIGSVADRETDSFGVFLNLRRNE